MDEIEVSFFRTVTDQMPERIKLSQWLFGIKEYESLLTAVRAEKNKDAREVLKRKLPCITPSGIFRGASDQSLVEHSGFIGIDIDDISPMEAKDRLSVLPWVYYAGLSASGLGMWALVPIRHPAKHREHFMAIKNDMADHGLMVDQNCVNESRKRFYSSDEDPIINRSAQVYGKLAAKPLPEPVHLSGDEYHKARMLLSRIMHNHTDITQTYHDWLLVGGALASMFGEDGRWLFHQMSCYHEEYSKKKADKQYDKCLLNKRDFGIGILFKVAKKYGVLLKE